MKDGGRRGRELKDGGWETERGDGGRGKELEDGGGGRNWRVGEGGRNRRGWDEGVGVWVRVGWGVRETWGKGGEGVWKKGVR